MTNKQIYIYIIYLLLLVLFIIYLFISIYIYIIIEITCFVNYHLTHKTTNKGYLCSFHLFFTDCFQRAHQVKLISKQMKLCFLLQENTDHGCLR